MFRFWQLVFVCLWFPMIQLQAATVIIPLFGLSSFQNKPLSSLVQYHEVKAALDVLLPPEPRACFNQLVPNFPYVSYDEKRGQLSSTMFGLNENGHREGFFSVNAKGEIHIVLQCDVLFSQDKMYQYFTNLPFTSPPSSDVVDFLWTIKADRFPIVRSNGEDFLTAPMILSDRVAPKGAQGGRTATPPLGKSLQEATNNYNTVLLNRLWRCQVSGKGIVPDVELLYFNPEHDFVSKTGSERIQGVYYLSDPKRIEVSLLVTENSPPGSSNSLQIAWTSLTMNHLNGAILDRRTGLTRQIECNEDIKK